MNPTSILCINLCFQLLLDTLPSSLLRGGSMISINTNNLVLNLTCTYLMNFFYTNALFEEKLLNSTEPLSRLLPPLPYTSKSNT